MNKTMQLYMTWFVITTMASVFLDKSVFEVIGRYVFTFVFVTLFTAWVTK